MLMKSRPFFSRSGIVDLGSTYLIRSRDLKRHAVSGVQLQGHVAGKNKIAICAQDITLASDNWRAAAGPADLFHVGSHLAYLTFPFRIMSPKVKPSSLAEMDDLPDFPLSTLSHL